ncbi:glutamate racemase [Urechidicola vernalis]|uniref:Glutamate racemase n=1 Tax=Urechidicola vernalis TaxID=3075600 RepID=A0ABU2Y4I9_9FLAO|nr:glutamate racemase [Urechidicola sp. P050]MDT0553096.1 glutamate racemase [Urechidicola sp. P050]
MQKPIGIFDSGIGGTSIWREINTLLPNENTIYLADSINAPYGEQAPEKIIEFCIKNTELLIQKGCKLIVVACNTATTNAIDILREKYDIPFIGIEPAIKPAAINSKTNSVGILATKGTLSSSLFAKTSEEFAWNVQITEQVGTGLVTLIETGKLYSDEMTNLLHNYLNPMLDKNIDYLVLGCSHYPYLIPQIKEILGPEVTIIDSGLAVAKQTKTIAEKYNLLNKSKSIQNNQFYTNSDVSIIEHILKDLKEFIQISHLNF